MLQPVCAQNSNADMQKKMQKAQAEIEKMKNDPKMQELMKRMPKMDSLSKNLPPTAKTAISKTNGKTAANTFPARNDKLLATIPKKIFTKPELINFLSVLHNQLESKLSADKVAAAKETVLELNKDPMNISMAGCFAWYKSAPSEAALLITYAAAASPDDNILNNCGAILNLCGLEEKAIPVLKYALSHQPANSTLLNNLGQAYAGLGALDTAVYYLGACISKSNTHPEACGTVAYIEAQRGHNEEAIHMAEQAIKGGYSAAIAAFYKKLKKDANLLPLLEDNLDPTARYFDMADWNIPPLCRSWQQSGTIYPRQQAFLKKIATLRKGFENEAKGDGAPVFNNTRDILVWSLSQDISVGPLHDVAQELEDGFTDLYSEAAQKAYMEWLSKFMNLNTNEGTEALAIVTKYAPLIKAAEKNIELAKQLTVQQCLEQLAMKNKYLAAKADATEKYKDERFSEDVKFYNNMVFLSRFTAPNEKTYRSVCGVYATQMLNNFSIYAGGVGNVCNPAQKPNCGEFDPAKEYKEGDPKFSEANCPVDLKISFAVGKLMINCSRYELEAGEGIILNFEKNFISRETTVAIGIGAATFIPGVPGTDLSPAEAQTKNQLYIKFDKNNQPTDIGMAWETELDVKFVATEIKTGYTIGINSGYNFNEGPLKGILNQPGK
ncbi:MAG: hypothetical protein ABI480_10645 [Chitinophagaceae bacterium]